MMVLRKKKVRKNEIEKKKSYVDQSGDGRLGVAQTPPLLLGRVDEGVGGRASAFAALARPYARARFPRAGSRPRRAPRICRLEASVYAARESR